MLLSDWKIRKLANGDGTLLNPLGPPDTHKIPKMIEPFSEGMSGNGIISYGLSHAGYDLRLDTEIWEFNPKCGEVIDPKRFSDPEYQEKVFIKHHIEAGQSFTISPGGYILGSSYEYLRIPRNIKGRAVGKSTYARSLL